jgi:hypothetical protein
MDRSSLDAAVFQARICYRPLILNRVRTPEGGTADNAFSRQHNQTDESNRSIRSRNLSPSATQMLRSSMRSSRRSPDSYLLTYD